MKIHPQALEDVEDMNSVKDKLGVPTELRSWHTATVDGYVIEDHVWRTPSSPCLISVRRSEVSLLQACQSVPQGWRGQQAMNLID